ncbi:DUF4921 family protein [candidate division KSB1 bacterium]|nr:DUF4921 family protein [candidate division KSB1 bacterium]
MRKIMPDGTEKHFNPITGTEVWYIPGRKDRPIFTQKTQNPGEIIPSDRESVCNFCPQNYFNTPPEKVRLVRKNGIYEYQEKLSISDVLSHTADFRCIPNLFEIVTLDYWRKNYNYQFSRINEKFQHEYLADPVGRNHIVSIINLKLSYSGLSADEISAMPVNQKLAMADPFFHGCHELIVPRRHFIPGAQNLSQLASSGEFSADEHYLYFDFTIRSIERIYRNNRYVRYISVYQNWRKDAGASFDHLHKQLVGLDEWGISIEHETTMVQQYPNLYNEYGVNFAGYNNLVICENLSAIAFVDLGHSHPTVAIYSKSPSCQPWRHTEQDVRGMSDIVHAVHSAMGAEISCNEEWYYMPKDSPTTIPWHIFIKWRVNTPAGFEGGTKIFVVPYSLYEVRDRLVPRLFQLRADGRISQMDIAQECPVKPNSLAYVTHSKHDL